MYRRRGCVVAPTINIITIIITTIISIPSLLAASLSSPPSLSSHIIHHHHRKKLAKLDVRATRMLWDDDDVCRTRSESIHQTKEERLERELYETKHDLERTRAEKTYVTNCVCAL